MTNEGPSADDTSKQNIKPLVTLHGEDVVVPADTVCRSVHKGQESSRPAANPLPPGVHVVLPKLERGGSVGGDQVLQVELEEPRSASDVWIHEVDEFSHRPARVHPLCSLLCRREQTRVGATVLVAIASPCLRHHVVNYILERQPVETHTLERFETKWLSSVPDVDVQSSRRVENRRHFLPSNSECVQRLHSESHGVYTICFLEDWRDKFTDVTPRHRSTANGGSDGGISLDEPGGMVVVAVVGRSHSSTSRSTKARGHVTPKGVRVDVSIVANTEELQFNAKGQRTTQPCSARCP
mmetsp:Transcript_61876/g.146521  ORF Transcript_61876/g.146521 Transcript_61876/m.146521 type:complete len:296 (-) Transcript_61876:358-1245(-)